MCGRYSIFQIANTDEVEERFDVTLPESVEPRYNAAPGQQLPVITNDEPDAVSQLQWGLIPHWADDPEVGNQLINARAETVDEKNSFRGAYQNRRCLVLADGFYEWAETGNGKQPYRVVANNEPFAIAGLWEQWDPADAGGQANLGSFADDDDSGVLSDEILETYTIITTEPNEVVGDIHDRMPVVLAPDEEDQWLAGDTSSGLKGLLDPYDEEMNAYPVSTDVNNPSNDSPQVVVEAET